MFLPWLTNPVSLPQWPYGAFLIGETAMTEEVKEVVPETRELSPIPEDILSFFPLEKARPSQEKVILETDKVFRQGKRFVILRAPVGSGKSAIAMTFARAFQSSHVITPRKSLQDQYYDDFKDDIVLMKGRSSYPCTIHDTPARYKKVIKAISQGQVKAPTREEDHCGDGPCKSSEAVWKACINGNGPCPYTVAIETAQKHHTIVHNIHSFIFQTNFSSKFERRSLMIVDEAHDLEGVIRGFITKKFTVGTVLSPADVEGFETLDAWCDFFLGDRFIPEESEFEKAQKLQNPEFQTSKDDYITRVETLRMNSEYYEKAFSVKQNRVFSGSREVGTSFEFIPHSISNAAHHYMFDYADRIILMSGTIYDHAQYCRSLGINPADAVSIEISSSFPVQNRPIYLKPEYQVNTSFATWKDNFQDMIKIIDRIQGIFKDVKGLIHAPSYETAGEIVSFAAGNRMVTHGKHDFQEKLEAFYASDLPLIFVSPVCSQGVDFKNDRARFQIIVRVPYLNTSDPFVSYMMQNNFDWYNYQALVVFGQQTGRVNRNESDFGATFLLDERFHRFLSTNSRRLPQWLKNAFVYK
jgi:Rad3-related DNA helicase